MSDNLDDIPLPEPCTIEDKLVSTRKDLVEEQDGNLFNRKCDNLDTTIPKRKDRFIECEELPEVPKVLLKNKQFNEVEFPGVPLAEIPKKLMAHLLSCCLEGRTAGFDFEIVEAFDEDENKKEQMDDVSEALTTLSIQLGTYSYLLIGLDIRPELCFCDETCGDEDYIHIKVKLDAEYHDEDGDNILEDPDITIDDEQLTNLIANYGGGGGGNPLCAQKMFGVYAGESNAQAGYFVPYGLVSYTSSDLVYAYLAPYLTGFEMVPNGIYKLEYFCEYKKWYVTDGQCSNLAPLYSYPSYILVEATGLANETFTGTLILQNGGELYPYTDYTPFALDSSASTDTEANTFVDGITFTKVGNTGLNVKYSFQIKEGADASMVYTTVLSNSTGSCSSKTMKFIFKVKEETPEVEEEEE